MKTPESSMSVNHISFCTIDQLEFELCEDSVGKKAASDNKASVFYTPSTLCRKAVAGPLGLKKQVQQHDFTLSETDLMIPFSQLFIPHFILNIHI